MSYIGFFPGDAKQEIHLLWNYIHSRFYNILNEFHTVGTGIRRPNNNDSSQFERGGHCSDYHIPREPLEKCQA
jgi:hypothetical protein